ncbi:antifreeze protein [Cognatishimia sp. F0-27]|uniref:antifreeze protein n=1 Tax=Cognatishimia sp. F0-27 TaxID=2816855 RepID=UPI001D0C02F3|nr:antifreeze protein [Cognatishimia sp. F0-27]MCC1491983.1 antifreeze protein [Cognatishimia sp. F0-27]
MTRFLTDPQGVWGNVVSMTMLAAEAQAVIAMRGLGMLGLWPVAPGEHSLMVTEKVEAMTQGVTDAHVAFLRGGSSDAVAAAAIAPVREATKANAHRLSSFKPGA